MTNERRKDMEGKYEEKEESLRNERKEVEPSYGEREEAGRWNISEVRGRKEGESGADGREYK